MVNIIAMDPGLRIQITKNLPTDRHLGRIYKDLIATRDQDDNKPGDVINNGFKLDAASGLLYLVRDVTYSLFLIRKQFPISLGKSKLPGS